MDIHTVFIQVLPNTKPISDIDAHVPGIYEIRVDNGLTPAQAAGTALDIFHSRVPIDVLDQFIVQSWVQGKTVEQPADWEDYSGINSGYLVRKMAPVPATICTEGQAVENSCDASHWLLQASVDEICALAQCGFRTDHADGSVVVFMEIYNPRVTEAHQYLLNNHLPDGLCGFEIRVSETEAIDFLMVTRPEVYLHVRSTTCLNETFHITATIKVIYDAGTISRNDAQTLLAHNLDHAIACGILSGSGDEIIAEYQVNVG